MSGSRGRRYRRTCPICGKEFDTFRSVNKQTCGRACGHELRSRRAVEGRTRKCTVCGTDFTVVRKDRLTRHCSPRCRRLFGRQPVVVRNGVCMLLMPSHPRATKDGYYVEHRYIVEMRLGRYLERDEFVRHINGDKGDNRAENLRVVRRTARRLAEHAAEAGAPPPAQPPMSASA
jgi:endogenous inhibitor of DNA gyrase (YacG/DUF329 family)